MKNLFAILIALFGFICTPALTQKADSTKVTAISADSLGKMLSKAPGLQLGKKRFFAFDSTATTVKVKGKKIIANFVSAKTAEITYELTLTLEEGGFGNYFGEFTSNVGLKFTAGFTSANPTSVEVAEGGKILLIPKQ